MNKLTEELLKEFDEIGFGNQARIVGAKRVELKDFLRNRIDTLLQKEREAGKREGIEDLKKLIEKSRGNDYHNIGIGELDYHEKCAVDAYIETLKSRMSKLKSQSVEKGKKNMG